MARTEARTQTAIWDNTEFLNLPPVQKAVYWVVYSQADINHCGVIALRVGRWATKFGVTPGQFRAALDGLESARFILIDDEYGELAIRTFIRNDGVMKQPNILRAAHRSLAQVFSAKIRASIACELSRLLDEFSSLVPEGSKPIITAMLADLDQASPNPSGTLPGTPREGFGDAFPEPVASTPGDRGKGKGEEVEVRTTKASNSSRSKTSSGNAKPKKAKAVEQHRPDVEELCTRLVEHRVRLKCKRPTVTQAWRDDARRLLDLDGRSLEEALRVLDWSQHSTFWNPNIKSIPKFRAQYDTLRLQMEQEERRPSNVVAIRGGMDEKHAMLARQRAWAEAEDAKELAR